MSERRKPQMVFRVQTNAPKGRRTWKVEVFRGTDWPNKAFWTPKLGWVRRGQSGRRNKFRLRVNGKWYRDNNNRDTLLTKWQFRDILWKSLEKRW